MIDLKISWSELMILIRALQSSQFPKEDEDAAFKLLLKLKGQINS